ncbi:stationary phase inducible protein CsiE [Erwinia sp. 9145]|uniref:stationary phase inducible protein CsiE n=1 Tax=Erwinia sp. 9145 TaxID=1500895 RepID=UPI00054FC064|nr:stationary phase inducible protein CsiE [Erwinia sp. 9145]
MSSPSPTSSAFSSPQRHCHLMLMFYLPETVVTLDSLSQLNGVDRSVTRQDIAKVDAEIQRYHRLGLVEDADGSYRMAGAELDQRLCLFHWLRRALRLAPDFVQERFTPALRRQLKARRVNTALYDERNLSALILHCAQGLSREFTPRNRLFLQLFMQHSLCRDVCATFSSPQRSWLVGRQEYPVAERVIRHWQKRCDPAPDLSQAWLFALLFSQLHVPSMAAAKHEHEQQVLEQVRETIARFESLSEMQFSDREGLCSQLYTHLAQAMERSLFGIGIDNSLTEEVARLYPRLLRTTQTAVEACEQRYGLRFSQEELALIAIIFGAWLMQDNVLQEKQVLLLTAHDKALEQQVEQQLRELTLLPLTIKYLSVGDFQRDSAPKGTALVITPYATPLPLYSPPLIHAELPLQAHQQQRIRLLLES